MFRLLYVGQVSEAKGVGDVIRALSLLPKHGADFAFRIFGEGRELEALKSLAVTSRIQDRVIFLGKASHQRVLEEMRGHDAVLVPSRHEYPEGLPMTIYEALCTRTPAITSDHPMFLKRIVPDGNAVVFRASDPGSLAAAIRRLRADAGLYAQLSKRAGEAAEHYLCPLKWDVLIDRWLEDSSEAEAWLETFSLARRSYC